MKQRPLNILFTSSGRRVNLLRHFQRTLVELGIPGKILAGDASSNVPTAFVADCFVLLPRIESSSYIDTLLEQCIELQVSLLFPLIDSDLGILARNRQRFFEKGIQIIISSPEAIDIANDKRLTNAFFQQHFIDTPHLFTTQELESIKANDFPLLIKPWNGSSSIGVTKITTPRELEFFSSYIPNAMIQEFIVGSEFTCDVLCGISGQIKCVVPRRRIAIRSGEVSKSVTVKDQSIITAVEKLITTLPEVVGGLTVQCFRRLDGRLCFTEINPRFAGGITLSLQAGADFPRWLIQEYLGLPCGAQMNAWRDGLVMLRFDDEIIVPEARIK
ncbi:ATP-grasp domain-containing protein [Geothrix sp. PMB-07]|uniref:ATP-grasp domain-containing protein n=1 Tax=Geothrix sp. PMB-07 TaxID=3068640 RepID=UPI002740E5D9|nr:ATP-grasp domain-containing protein [Geothrix sp. PMB-07]WLT32817.1 ATP-grasp domain-containing protein [Geothrix sp. PMB-07]